MFQVPEVLCDEIFNFQVIYLSIIKVFYTYCAHFAEYMTQINYLSQYS